jgi:transposase
MTNRLAAYVIDRLGETFSFTSIAKQVNLSVSTVIRIFDLVDYGKPTLGNVLGIDEYKGNTGKEKYQCILSDPENGQILDILPDRFYHNLAVYFKGLNRSNTFFVVSDMWKPYADIFGTYFKTATHVLDRYHIMRQVEWAFEAVRKEEQKRFSKSHRIYFKHSRFLLLKPFDSLADEQKQQVNVMLYASPNLSSAYYLKQSFCKLSRIKDAALLRQELSSWILHAQNSSIPRFHQCADTFITGPLRLLMPSPCLIPMGLRKAVTTKSRC